MIIGNNKLKPHQIDELIENLDMQPVLNQQVRQVKWLYNNSNKLLKVYEEKLVRLMIHKLTKRIEQLETQPIKGQQGELVRYQQAGMKLIEELYRSHNSVLKNLDISNEDKKILIQQNGISAENYMGH